MTEESRLDNEFSAFGTTRVESLSRVQKFVAEHLERSWKTIPHVTHHDSADITDLERRRSAWRSAEGDRLTFVALVVKALASTLKAFPRFNASLQGDRLIIKEYVHIGVAVDTPGGLLVPVIRDCDRKSPSEIGAELATLSERARTKGLPLSQMSGGCMTVTSLGGIGGTAFTPIINPPELAILGVSKSHWTASRAADEGVKWLLMLPLSLSYDHRVINGADAARFVCHLSTALSELGIE